MNDLDFYTLMLIIGISLLSVKLIRFSYNSRLKELEASGVALFRKTKEETTCSAKKEPHDWEEVKLTENDKTTSEQVCCSCGVIFGSENQFTEEGVNKLKAKRQAVRELKIFYSELESYKNTQLLKLGLQEEVNGGSAKSFQAGYDSYKIIEAELQVRMSARVTEAVAKIWDETNSK